MAIGLSLTCVMTAAGLLLIISFSHGRPVRRPITESDVNLLANEYVEYLSGTGLNVILSAPHGGSENPSDIPDRDAGCWDGNQCVWNHTCGTKDPSRCEATTVSDLNTAQLTRELRLALCDRFDGRCPSAVINLLHRRKLDANRPRDEAAFGDPQAADAFDEYHRIVELEKSYIGSERALFIDVHGHGHTLQLAELGYLVSASGLNSGDPVDPTTTSIRGLADYADGSGFEELLRGATSFGGILEDEGFGAVPSPTWPGPGSNAYFSGGYNTRVHGSVGGGYVDGIQIESASSFRNLPMRTDYVIALVNTIARYIELHFPPQQQQLR